MAEDIVQWPYDADPMSNSEVSEGTRIMAANENDEDKMASVTVKQLADKAAERVEYTGIEIDPLQGGETEETATEVPAGPAGENQKAEASPGWYDFGEGPVEAAPERKWIAWWNGESWELKDMGAYPDNSANAPEWQDGEYSEGDLVRHKGAIWSANKDTTEEPSNESADWDGASNIEIAENFSGGEGKVGSADDVKELNERVQFYDRPDLPFHHYLVGKNKNIIDRLLSEKADRHRFLPEEFTLYTIDRPDLGAVILVDKNNKILGHSGSNSGGGDDGGETKARVMLPMFNPKEQQSFNVPAAGDSSALSDYGVLIDEYDSLLEEVNVGTEYMIKRTIGQSAVGNLPIELYSLKPAKPLAKVLLIGGTHAAEKMFIDVLRHFARDVAVNWESDPFLNFLRWNVQIDILPCRIPYALKNTKRARGTRCAPETEPVPFTWTKSGNVVTLTFDTAQFPDDGFLTGATYFTSVPASALVNRQAVHVSLSSDETAVPISTYPIASVLSGSSITFNTPEAGGASSGSGFFEVWVDPNRNMAYSGSNAWFTYNSNATQQYTDDGVFYTYMVSKGTRPQSLRDNRAFIALIDEEEYDWVVDGHSPAGDNDVRYDSETGFIPDRETILAQTGAFVNSSNNVHDSAGSFGSTPYTSASMRDYGTNFWTIEWGSGLNNATGVQVRNAYRWLTIILTNALHNLLNK